MEICVNWEIMERGMKSVEVEIVKSHGANLDHKMMLFLRMKL